MYTSTDYREARRRVERKIGLYIHLAVFLVVNTGLLLFALPGLGPRGWVPFPLIGWGIGLLFHALAVHLAAPGARWKRRMIERELRQSR